MDSKSRHFVEKRPAESIGIELERAFAINFDSAAGIGIGALLIPRPAAESLSVVRQSGPASRSCAVRAQKKWRHHNEHSSRTRTCRWNKTVEKDPLCCFRRTFRQESWLICWKVCACRSLLRRHLRSWSGR